MGRRLILFLAVMTLTGCITGKTNKNGLMNQIQLRVINLERKVEEKEREIVDLKFQVKELSSRLDSDELDVVRGREGIVMVEEPVVSRTKKTASQGNDKDNIIRMNVSPKTVQMALKNAGYYKGPIDSVIGSGTKAAIVEFQRNHGLVTDGIVGKNTWREMKLYLDQ